MSFEQLKVDCNDLGVALITLQRPNAANALSLQLLEELNEAFEQLNDNQAVRCIILTGEGEKAFCAGADLKERATMTEAEAKRTVQKIRDTINKLEALTKPVIAALNGAAFGGGLELALACDIRISSDKARMGLTETSLGIIPGAGGTQRLSRLIGKGKAKELIFTASKITSEEAYRLGIVEHVISADKLLEKAYLMAERISVNAPIAIAQAKFAIDKGFDLDLQTGLALEEKAYQALIATKDRKEGLLAFKEKRKPSFRGE